MEKLRSPRRPDLAAVCVMARESEVASLARRYPCLSPSQILEIIKSEGPLRRDVEAALDRVSSEISRQSRD